MIQRNFTVVALAALALVACRQAADDSAIAIDNSVNAAETGDPQVETLPPDDSSAAAPETPAAMPTKASPLATSIPAPFHGRWGINRADCTSTRGDAKGLLTINDARLTFYESRGAPTTVLGVTATSFDANYAFTGEGQAWERIERLKLVNDRLQRRTDAAPGQEPPVNLTYERCGE